MELKQRQVLQNLLIPELAQSLKILTLPLLELKELVEQELVSNPFLEERALPSSKNASSLPKNQQDWEFKIEQITKAPTLRDVLLRQLGMFANSEEELRIGVEIIENTDENGYLKATIDEIAAPLGAAKDEVERVLKIVQQFEPAGVCARTPSECLLIQLDFEGEKDPILRNIVEFHLEDVAKKNYSHIAKNLKIPPEEIEPLIKKILRLDPKPGRNYSADEAQRVIPDVIIEDTGDDFEIMVSGEELSTLTVNKEYKQLLKKDGIDPKDKEFLRNKLRNALELVRSISRRQRTLVSIVKVVAEIQQEAIREDLSGLKPLTFKEVAQRLNIHETTVCRAVMNKYVKLPECVVSLRDLFPGRIQDKNGQAVSEVHIKRRIKDLIAAEDKKHPLSDQEIAQKLSESDNLNVARRTVTKYREELRILCSTFRKER